MSKEDKTVELEVCTPPVVRKTLFERVAAYLDAKDWNYSAFEEKHYFSSSVRLRDSSVRMIVDVAEDENFDRVLVYSIYPTFVPQHRRMEMLQAINHINRSLAFGSLEMDAKDGELRVRTAMKGVGNLEESQIEQVIDSALATANRFHAALLAVAFGNVSPEMVVDLAERCEEQTLQ